jgi:glyoxylase-like metal-dependent hydrolase (beta-lactamase superfamily II)
MAVEYSVISIGTTAQNLLWNESRPARTAHATCTLIVQEDRRILVDPSLPGEVLRARLFERTGQGPETITDVFCTTLRPDGRRGLDVLAHAPWYAGETELEWYGRQLESAEASSERLTGEQADDLRGEIDLLKRFRPVPEEFAPQVTRYPLFGATPGCTGLLLTPPTQTVVVAGPAVPTREHLQRGMVWEHAADREQAMETLGDLLELADIVIPGYDNLVIHPRRLM